MQQVAKAGQEIPENLGFYDHVITLLWTSFWRLFNRPLFSFLESVGWRTGYIRWKDRGNPKGKLTRTSTFRRSKLLFRLDGHSREDKIRCYWSYREELLAINGLIFKGERTAIPTSLQRKILSKLHQAHLGIEKTKLRARETVFWPNTNQHIEDLVSSCSVWIDSRNENARQPMISSDVPEYPFQTVGSDLFHWNN